MPNVKEAKVANMFLPQKRRITCMVTIEVLFLMHVGHQVTTDRSTNIMVKSRFQSVELLYLKQLIFVLCLLCRVER